MTVFSYQKSRMYQLETLSLVLRDLSLSVGKERKKVCLLKLLVTFFCNCCDCSRWLYLAHKEYFSLAELNIVALSLRIVVKVLSF